MDKEEFEAWKAVTASSRNRWIEDEIVRLNGGGVMYYTGGEDGRYVRISPEGVLITGAYKSAYPHIGEAFFTIEMERSYGSFSEAFYQMCQLGGAKFRADLFPPNS